MLGKRPVAVVVATLAAALVLVGAGPALAGTFTVNLDPAAGTGCDLLAPNGGLSQFLYGCDGITGSDVGLAYLQGNDGGVALTGLPAGSRIGYQVNAPAGVTITSAVSNVNNVDNINDGGGWGGGGYWAGGGDAWITNVGAETDGPFNSPYWGFQQICGWSNCNNDGAIILNSIQLTASESQGPSLAAMGSNNLWYQTGHYVWNPPGDPWPITLQASDPTGVCNVYALVNGIDLPGPSASPDTSEWQQCPDPTWTTAQGATVDTRDYITGDGQLSLTLGASNAAGVSSQPSEMLAVDNDPVTVSLSTPNDPNPSVWANHAVTVDAVGHTGPSLLASLDCSVDSGTPEAYPSGGITVNGNGQHTISCTAANRATGPQGQPNTGTATMTVDIDEQPPSLGIDPQDPSVPDQVVVATSDSESPVTSGEIEIAPQGTSDWTALSTALTSAGQLVAMIPDAGLTGPYTIQATACSQVGNCGSTSETLTMPLRVTAQSDVSFEKVIAPAKVVRERVLVGWHYKRARRHGETVRVRVGGHVRKIRVVIRTDASCGTTRVKTGRRRWQEVRVCRERKLKLMTHELVRFRHPATVHGVLLSGQGVPIANTVVQIWTAPDNGLDQFTQVASTTTSSDGAWAITLPAGPSRLVQARYPGSATILPATGQVTLSVPAKIKIVSVTPRHIPWGATIKITAELAGGYLPASGELVELFYSYGHDKTPYNVKTHVTTRRFTTSFTFGPGQTPLTFGFQMRALPDPAYAYAPASSNTVDVRVGGLITPSSSLSGGAKRHHKAHQPANTKHKAKAKRKAKHRRRHTAKKPHTDPI